MSYVRIPKFWKLLAFRMSLWCGGVLALSALLCFFIFYMIMVSSMRTRTNFDLSNEARKLSKIAQTDGFQAVKTEIEKEANSAGVNDIFFRIFKRGGNEVASSNLHGWSDVPLTNPLPASLPGDAPHFEDWYGSGHHSNVRVLTAPLDSHNVVQIGFSVQDDQRVVQGSRRLISFVMVGMVLLAVVLGWFVANRALRGVKVVAATARKISAGALDMRVPVYRQGDEIDALAESFNQMLDRINALVEGMKGTNDNIAHELRSPIARIRGLAETTLLCGASTEDYKAMAANTIEGCDSLLGIINTMLDIAEAEAGVLPLAISEIDVGMLVCDTFELYTPVAKGKRISVTVHSPQGYMARADLRQMPRALANLIDNAIKYAPEDGRVETRVTRTKSGIDLSIYNSGKPILEEDLPHIFERFYRGKNGRLQQGSGLGLSLAYAIIQAQGGDIRVQNVADGICFTISLPSASPNADLIITKN